MFLEYLSWQVCLLVLFVSYVASVYIARYARDRRIKKLGGVAPKIKTSFIFGLDYPVNSTRANLKNRTLEFWDDLWESTGCLDNLSYTNELHLLAAERIIFTADVENIKAILTTQFQDYGKGPQFHSEWKEFLGDSIFTTDHQQWHDSRQLIRPMFIREKVADLDLVETHVRKLIGLVGSGDGQMVELHKLLFRFSLDAATHFLFGKAVGSLDNQRLAFAAGFDEVQRVQVLRGRLGPLRHYYQPKSFQAGLRTMEEFIEPFITAALALSPEELETKISKSDTFIHSLARYTRDKKVMRDQLTSLLLAGRDTTASSLSWVFLELARNPRIFEKLRAEVIETVGNDGRPPTYQEIKDMKYLTHTLNETLRLYPVVPLNVRSALVDTTLPRGGGPDGMQPLGILKNTPIGYSTISLHRRRDLYPPISATFPYDPLLWVPDRWETWSPKPWTYIPFNGGPRICIGQQFALVEMGYTICRILQEFDQLIDYGNTSTLHTDIVLTPADGVKIGFVKSSK